MELLSQGDITRTQKLYKRCSRCNCEFSCVKADIEYGHRFFDDVNTVHFVVCPTCNCRIFVSSVDYNYLSTKYTKDLQMFKA